MQRPLVIIAAVALACGAAVAPLTAAVADPTAGEPTAAPTASPSTPAATTTPGPGAPTPVAPGSHVLVYPANPVAAPGNPANATATWVGGTLRIVYDFAFFRFPIGFSDADVSVLVDGALVGGPETFSGKGLVVEVPRAASAGPAHVVIRSNGYIERGSWYDVEQAWLFEATVPRQVVTAKPGQVSARRLLGELRTAKETRSGSYQRSRFRYWVDADRDGERTRSEVLKAESLTEVVENRHRTVVRGRWRSLYDGRVLTAASAIDLDHLVPLREAWTSGAAAWSERRRTAYANDVGYGASLIAVSKQAGRAKGDREPDAYLPSTAASTCTYVRRWIAVKHRWDLAVDAAERHALAADLARCANPFVAKPRVPDVARLAGR